MSDARYREAHRVFLEVCDLPPHERRRRLVVLCGEDHELRDEVSALLESDADSASLEWDAVDAGALLADALNRSASEADDPDEHEREARSARSEDEPLPESIGDYRIVRRIGAGGMGIVYEAEQRQPRRTIALKVIRASRSSPELLMRFRRECEILGRLGSPGIAHVYDAGVAEEVAADGRRSSRAFLVLELVDGRPIDEHANHGSLDTRARLALVARVCDAIHHAHQRGVIHRDLKPANILVDESGQPKILDFGVARVIDEAPAAESLETTPGQWVGTLSYMSPEQIAGNPDDIDTRVDIYGLGAVLFELLAGRQVHEAHGRSTLDLARDIRERDASRLGTIDPALAGDVETIVSKALERERDRRYASAAELASDLRRFLDDEPILARPPSALYQIRKFTHRHRGLVAASGALLLAIVTGLAASLYLYVSAEVARAKEADSKRVAEREAATARSVNAFLVELLTTANPAENPDGNGMRVGDLLDLAVRRTGAALEGEPEVEGIVRFTIGKAYLALGRHQDARQALAAARERIESLRPPPPDLLAEANILLGDACIDDGDYDTARNRLDEAIEIARRHPIADATHAHAHNALTRLFCATGDFAAAEAAQSEAIVIARRISPDSDSVGEALHNLGAIRFHLGRYAAAEEALREALTLFRDRHGDLDVTVAHAINSLGVLLRTRGKLDEAERLYEEALHLQHELYGDRHPMIATTLNNIARLCEERGDLAEARAKYVDALEMRRHLFGDEHVDVAAVRQNLGVLELRDGRLERARSLLTTALESRRRLLGDHPAVAESLLSCAAVAERSGDAAGAISLAREAVVVRRARFGDGFLLGAALIEEGRLTLAGGDPSTAMARIEEGLAMLTRDAPEEREQVVKGKLELAKAALASDDPDRAEQLARESLIECLDRFGEGHPVVLEARSFLEGLGVTADQL